MSDWSEGSDGSDSNPINVIGGAGQGAALGSMVAPGVGTLIGGALGAISGLFGSKSSAKAQQAANDQNMRLQQMSNEFNAAQAQKQMDFQERMSGTAHQREIEDLTKAGLNPILSSKYGGSSTPSGAAAVSQATRVDPVPRTGIGPMFQGMMSGAREGLGSAAEANKMEMDWKRTEQVLVNSQQDLLNAVKQGTILGNVGDKSFHEAASAKADAIIRTVEAIWQKHYGFEVRQEELNKLRDVIKNIEADTKYVNERQRQEAVTAAIMSSPFYREFMGHVVQSAPGINAAANVGSKLTDLIPWSRLFKK